MSSGSALVIGLAAAVAFPASARPGAILLGQAGAINNQIALVGADGVPQVIDSTPFIPADDNLTDLGDATHRFRDLWLGTSIQNTGDLAILLSGGATRTLQVSNPTGGQVANVAVDGSVSVGGVARFLSLGAGNALLSAGATAFGLAITEVGVLANGLDVRPSITGEPVEVTPYGELNTGLALNAQGAAEVTSTRDDAVNNNYVVVHRLIHTSAAPANGIGAALGFSDENAAGLGATVDAGLVGGQLLDATAGAEVGAVEMLPAFAGVLAEAGFRVSGSAPAAGMENGLELLSVSDANALAVGVRLRPYGTAADTSIGFAVEGTGNVLLDGGATGGVSIGVNAAAKVAFFATAPIARAGAIADPVLGATIDAECRAALIAVLEMLRPTTGYGLMAA